MLAVMQDDAYPAVRGIAWRSARSLGLDAPVTAFTATDGRDARHRSVAALAARARVTPVEPANVAELRAAADARAIEIGE